MADDVFQPIDLDGTLDQIDDLPGFRPPPTGAYVINFPEGFEFVDIENHKNCIQVKMEIVEVVECEPTALEDGEEVPVPGKTKWQQMYLTDNVTGLGFFKAFAKPFAEATGTKNIRALCAEVKGMNALVAGVRVYDKKSDRYNFRFKNVAVT